jgi:NDP-sugar pyrophosphorylase family protein
MKAMIFCAGLGTRFKPWTDEHPKALAVVNNKSLLQRNIEYLLSFGIRDIVINVHHFGEQIRHAIQKYNGWGANIMISDESGKLLETGGGLLHAKEFFTPGEPFITINADILTDLDINRLISFHEETKALISFGVTNRKTSRYLLFDERGRLCGWRNTNDGKERISRPNDVLLQKAYSCVVVFNYEIFRLMEDQGFNGKF